jgi:hypothetical protein
MRKNITDDACTLHVNSYPGFSCLFHIVCLMCVLHATGVGTYLYMCLCMYERNLLG